MYYIVYFGGKDLHFFFQEGVPVSVFINYVFFEALCKAPG